MAEVPTGERPNLIRAGLVAAGVPAGGVEIFAGVTDEIIATESLWDPDAVALALDSSFKGPGKFFGDDQNRMMPDGRSYATPRGLAQLTPWLFEQHHAAGTSAGIYDPVASIAALWRFIASHFAIDLLTGTGVEQFREMWFDHRTDWWWLTELPPFSSAPRLPGY